MGGYGARPNWRVSSLVSAMVINRTTSKSKFTRADRTERPELTSFFRAFFFVISIEVYDYEDYLKVLARVTPDDFSEFRVSSCNFRSSWTVNRLANGFETSSSLNDVL